MVMLSSPETTPPTYTNGGGLNHQLPRLVESLDHDALMSRPGCGGPGNEQIQEVPWTILCLPITKEKIMIVLNEFWMPLQRYPWRLPTVGDARCSGGGGTRPDPPDCRKFLGKSASDTLAFAHKSGVGRSGVCSWYASTQNDIIRNIPSIERQWQVDADNSLKKNGTPLSWIHGGKGTRKGKKRNALYGRKVAVQKKQIARRMDEHIAAQSKIVLDLLPRR